MIINVKDNQSYVIKKYDIEIDIGGKTALDINKNSLYTADTFVSDWEPVCMYDLRQFRTLFTTTTVNGFWFKKHPILLKGDKVFTDTIYKNNQGVTIPSEFFNYHYNFYVTPMVSARLMLDSSNAWGGDYIGQFARLRKYKAYFDNWSADPWNAVQNFLTFGLQKEIEIVAGINPVDGNNNPFYLCDYLYTPLKTNLLVKDELLGKSLYYGSKLFDALMFFIELKNLAVAGVGLMNQVRAGTIQEYAKDIAGLTEISMVKDNENIFKNIPLLDTILGDKVTYLPAITKYFEPIDILYCTNLDGGYAYSCTPILSKVGIDYKTKDELGATPELETFYNMWYNRYVKTLYNNRDYGRVFDWSVLPPVTVFGGVPNQGLQLEAQVSSFLRTNINSLIVPFVDYFICRNQTAYYIQVGVEKDA